MFNFNEVVKIYYFLVYCMIWNEKVQFLLKQSYQEKKSLTKPSPFDFHLNHRNRAQIQCLNFK